MEFDQLSKRVIGFIFEVRRHLGPLETGYQQRNVLDILRVLPSFVVDAFLMANTG